MRTVTACILSSASQQMWVYADKKINKLRHRTEMR